MPRVGAGISSFLDKTFPGNVFPFVFTQSSKSDLGWQFIALIETGRYKDYNEQDQLQKTFWEQIFHTQIEILPGPQRRMKWGVPDGTRNLQTGELVHDDLVISASMCALLDEQTWGTTVSEVIRPKDPLSEMDF
jgi:hypothetical protein